MNATRIRAQAGFNITELMVAVAIGLIVLASLTTFFVNTSSSRREIDRTSRQIENGRFAIDSLRQEVRLAGYFSDLNTAGVNWQMPDPCDTLAANQGFSLALLNVPVPFFGYAGDTAAPAACVLDRVPGSEVLVVRRFSTEPELPGAVGGSLNPYVQISRCSTDSTLTPWEFAAGNSGGWALRLLDCTSRAEVHRVRVSLFYLRTYSIAGDGIPTLVRLDLDAATAASGGYPAGIRASELVEGIRDLRFDYGVDNDNDGAPDVYLRCSTAAPCTATQWSNVVSVRVNLLSQNLEDTLGYVDKKVYDLGPSGVVGPLNDGKKRHAYQALISATNRSGPRESP